MKGFPQVSSLTLELRNNRLDSGSVSRLTLALKYLSRLEHLHLNLKR